MTTGQLVAAIDALDGTDPEHDRSRVEELLLSIAPYPVREASDRLMERCSWW